jgi:hypothetical protein
MTQLPTMSDERMAPPGKVWRCAVCGKYAIDLYGICDYHSRGWDESCIANAVLVDAGDYRWGVD